MECVNQQLSCYQLLNELSTGERRRPERINKLHVQAGRPLGYRLPRGSNGCLEPRPGFAPVTPEIVLGMAPKSDANRAAQDRDQGELSFPGERQ